MGEGEFAGEVIVPTDGESRVVWGGEGYDGKGFEREEGERIAFAIVPVEVRYPDRIVGMALLLWSMQ